MQSPEQFIQSYIDAKSDLQREYRISAERIQQKYFEEEYRRRIVSKNGDVDSETLLSVDSQDNLSVSVITEIKSEGTAKKNRYQLRLCQDGWRISGKEFECFVCYGVPGNAKCNVCLGSGWVKLK